MLPAATGGAASGARRGLAGDTLETQSGGCELAAGGWGGEEGHEEAYCDVLEGCKGAEKAGVGGGDLGCSELVGGGLPRHGDEHGDLEGWRQDLCCKLVQSAQRAK